jgi:hypothetical protein
MRSQRRVVIGSLTGPGTGVHQRSGQPRQHTQQPVLGVNRDLMRLDRAGTGIHHNFALRAQLVPGPPQPDLAHIQYPGVARKVCSARSTRAGSTASSSAEEAAMMSTITTPARSSARP